MIGDGEVWFEEQQSGTMKIKALKARLPFRGSQGQIET
jgi:hypothetical protein